MRNRLPLIAAALLCGPLLPLRAGDTAPAPAVDAPVVSTPTDTSSATGNLTTSYDLDADTAYVGDARTNFGSGVKGGVSEEDTSARAVLGLQEGGGPIYRAGLAFQRYSFGFSRSAPLPDILQSENLVLGVDFQLGDSYLIRAEADPGLYSDGRSAGFRDFNVPITLGGSYIASEDVQWVAGLGIDFNRQFPVIPAIGVRWALNDTWVIDAILPTPRLEYDWNKNLTLYLGGDANDGTYRLDRDFGDGYIGTAADSTAKSGTAQSKIVPKLKNAVVEYDEVRIGAGLSWKASKALTIEMEAGYLPYREFDFHRADMHFSNDDVAVYGRMSINAQF